MTSFKRFESKPVVKIILIYGRLNLWRHRQFITIFYQFLHIRIEIIHGSHMYILFLPRVVLYVSFLLLADARGKTSWHKGLPVVKTIYTYGFHELFLKSIMVMGEICWNHRRNSLNFSKWQTLSHSVVSNSPHHDPGIELTTLIWCRHWLLLSYDQCHDIPSWYWCPRFLLQIKEKRKKRTPQKKEKKKKERKTKPTQILPTPKNNI